MCANPCTDEEGGVEKHFQNTFSVASLAFSALILTCIGQLTWCLCEQITFLFRYGKTARAVNKGAFRRLMLRCTEISAPLPDAICTQACFSKRQTFSIALVA